MPPCGRAAGPSLADGDGPALTWVVQLPAGLRLLPEDGRGRPGDYRVLRETAQAAALDKRLPVLWRPRVTVVYDPPSRRLLSPGILAETAGPLVEGLADAGVITGFGAAEVSCLIGSEPFPGGRLRLLVTAVRDGGR